MGQSDINLYERIIQLKTILILDLQARLNQKIRDSLLDSTRENRKYCVKVTVDEENNLHLIVLIDPFTGGKLIFFLNVLKNFTIENKKIDEHYKIWYDVLALTEENLSLETVTYPYRL